MLTAAGRQAGGVGTLDTHERETQPAPAALRLPFTPLTNRVDLIEEDEARLLAARHLEQLTHHARTLGVRGTCGCVLSACWDVMMRRAVWRVAS
jgi:hypothetical protein